MSREGVQRDLLPLVEGKEVNWRKYLHGEHCRCYHDHNEMHYVTNGNRKFIWYPRTGMEQFFDLEQDPGELRDIDTEIIEQALRGGSPDHHCHGSLRAHWRGDLLLQPHCLWQFHPANIGFSFQSKS